MGSPVASVEIQAKSTGLRAQLREARSSLGKFADWTATKFGGGLARLGSKKGGMLGKGSYFGDAARTAGGNIMSGAIGRASGFLENVGRDVFDFQDKLTRLQIQGNQTPETMDAISKSIAEASNRWGVGKGTILEGATSFVTLTGNVDVAKASIDTFAKTAAATGSNVEELGTTAAAAFQNLKIEAKDFESFFSGMTAQGKMGAVELKDLASELSTIAPQWSQFSGGTGLKGARELGAALQIVKRGFGGDAAETVTGLNNFLTAVTKKSARFRDAGVASFFDVGKDSKGRKTKELKNVFDIVNLISKSKLANDPERLTKALGSSEAYRAFIQLRDGRKDMEAFVRAGMDNGVIQRDAMTYLESSTGRVKQTWEQMKNTLAEAFTPERIERAVQGFAQLAEHAGAMAGVADFFGGLKKAGGDIRSAITGEGRITMLDSMKAKAGDEGAQLKIANLTAAADYAKIRAADSPAARKALGMSATSSLDLASEYAGAEGKGAAAKRAAAAKYFKEAGITPGVGGAADQLGKMIDALKEIAANTAKDLEVKVGGDAVAKASKEAPKHRRGVAK